MMQCLNAMLKKLVFGDDLEESVASGLESLPPIMEETEEQGDSSQL